MLTSTIFTFIEDRPLDIAILVDWSTYQTAEHWQYIQDYLQNYVDQLKISSDDKADHVSLIGYSSKAGVVFNFKDSQNASDIKRRIRELDRQKGYRRPDEALKLVRSDIFTPAGGARSEARKVELF